MGVRPDILYQGQRRVGGKQRKENRQGNNEKVVPALKKECQSRCTGQKHD